MLMYVPQGSARPTEVDIEKTMPHTQRSVNRHQQDAQRERVMAMVDINDPRSLVGAQAAACTRSCSDGAASAYHNLRMANSHLTWELRFGNGIQIMPADNAGKRCPYGAMLRSMRDADHAMTCSKPGSVRTLRHDHLNEICCDAARCRRCSALHAPKWRRR